MPDLAAVATVVPSAGVFGLLAWLIIHTMKQSSSDRASYSQELASQADRHDRQITELQNQIERLRNEVAQVRAELDAERSARWQAEEDVARYRRMIGETSHGST